MSPFITVSRISLQKKKKKITWEALEEREDLLPVLITHVRTCVCAHAHTHTERGQGDTFGGDEMLMALIMIIVSWVYSFLQTH